MTDLRTASAARGVPRVGRRALTFALIYRGSTMATLKVWLEDWEHQCCGPERKVGQDILLNVYSSDGQMHEQRHDYQNGRESTPIRGRLTGIEWHPARPESLGKPNWHAVVGHEPGQFILSTSDRPLGESWAFEFTIESDDSVLDVGASPAGRRDT